MQKILGISCDHNDKPLIQLVLDLLHAQNKTLAVAESCTGGGICKLLTDLPGVSDVFGFGFVTYANEAKEKLLGVSRETILRFGAVSEQCAKEMADGALANSGAGVAVAVTGIAGPGSDNTNKPVGLIFLHATDGKKAKQLKLETGSDDRNHNRATAATQALELVKQILIEV